MHETIFTYITSAEAEYKQPIDILGWNWNMFDHVQQGFYYKHGRLLTGNSDFKPVKNIIRPILNLQYRAEDVDVKEITLYVDDKDNSHLSFFAKKYYEDVFLVENDLDYFLDEWKKARIDYGLGLAKDAGVIPENIPLESIAFCNQADILSGPIGILHSLSPSQLQDMKENGWGEESNGATITIDELLELVLKEETKEIKIYEVHGFMPERYLNDEGELTKHVCQVQIVGFYTKSDGNREGVILYRKAQNKMPFKKTIRDSVFGRACGFGGVEEIAENQTWVNYNQIRFREMLDAAAKIIMQTNDQSFRNKKLMDYDNLDVAVMEEGTTLSQVDTFPRNISLFEKYTQEWEAHAQVTGSANDSIMGESPNAGTPFKLQELVTQESHSLHDYRKGQYAKDVESVFRDWILPYISRQLRKDNVFLSSLSLEEMNEMVDKIAEMNARKRINRMGGLYAVSSEVVQMIIDEEKEAFMKDNKKFISILKDDFKNIPIRVKVNVAGKQKNLSMYTDKLVNIFRQIAVNPAVLDDPRMAKLFNKILEASGLEPMDFSNFKRKEQEQPQPQMAGQQLQNPNINQPV